MISSSFKPLASMALAAICVASAVATSAAPADKKFTWSTSNAEAKAAAMAAVNGIESFGQQPAMLENAKKAVAADPNFAFGQYLVATFTPPPEGPAEMQKALELAKKAPDGERRYIEAVALVRQQKAAEALPIFQALAKEYPDERMVHMMLGQIYVSSGNTKEARAAYERAIKLDGSTPRAYAFLGNLLVLEGKYADARKVYASSLEKTPKNAAPFFPYAGTAFSYVYEGNYDAAIAAMEKFRAAYVAAGNNQQFPEVFIWNSIGRMYLESGKTDKAIEAYKTGYKSVETSQLPEDQKQIWMGRLHHGMGRTLAKMGKHDEAWKEAETIKTMIDKGGEQGKQFMPAYHYIAGYLLYEKGDYAQAIEHMKQADLNDPFHMLVLARAYEKAGDQASAQKYYKAIVDSSQFGIERAIAFPEAKKKLKG
jgi:tetratricopeptide (TPR) repeat protein